MIPVVRFDATIAVDPPANGLFGTNNTGGYTVTTTVIPEPSTGLLVLMGLVLASTTRGPSRRR